MISGVDTGINGCPPEEKACADHTGQPECGEHGICESSLTGQYKSCRCLPGWFGKTCDKRMYAFFMFG